MTMKDLKPDRVGMARAGKIRLGFMLRKCVECKKATKAKVQVCQFCGHKNPAPEKKDMFPTSTNYFVLDDAPELVEVYGKEPKSLNIWFPFDDIEGSMQSAHKLYSASSMLCTGDGEMISYAINAQTGKPTVRNGIALMDFTEAKKEGGKREFKAGDAVPCPGYAHDFYKKCEFCRPNTDLRFLIREIPQFAFYQLVTGSVTNYSRLDEQMSYFTAPKSQGGMGVGLKGIPFQLSLSPEMVSVPNLDRNGNPRPGEPPKKRVEKYLLKLQIDPEYMRELTQVQKRLASPNRLLLGAPVEIDEPVFEDEFEDQADIIELSGPVIEFDAWDLSQDEFFNKVKAELKILPVIAGYVLKETGLVNGKGYEKEKARQYWAAIETTGADCQRFIDKVLDQVKYYSSPKQVVDFFKSSEHRYDAENEEYLFEELAKTASLKADAANA